MVDVNAIGGVFMSENVLVNHFKRRSKVYDQSSWVNNEMILNTILNGVDQNGSSLMRALDLGAGTGAVSRYILNNCTRPIDFYALDISEEMLKHINDPRINTIVAPAEELPFIDDAFDLIVSRQCLHYSDNLDGVISEIRRTLKCGGRFILTQFVPYEGASKSYWIDIAKHRQPLRKVFFSEAEWIEAFEQQGFMVCKIERFTLRSSITKWVDQYCIDDDQSINYYFYLLGNAPDEYKQQYDVVIHKNDIETNTFGVTVVFDLIK